MTWPEERSCPSGSDHRSEASLTFYYPVECSSGAAQPEKKKRKLGELTTKSALADVRAEDVDERGEKEEEGG